MSSTDTRSMESQSGALARWDLDKSDLKSIKVSILRRHVNQPNTSDVLLRSMGDPNDLKIHYRTDEGSRPIFDRADIMVNKESQEERNVASVQPGPSRSSSSSRSSSERDRKRCSPPRNQPNRNSPPRNQPNRSSPPRNQPNRSSPPRNQPSDSKSRRRDYLSGRYRRSNSNSRKAIYRSGGASTSKQSEEKEKSPKYYNKQRSSRSPGRRRSRSPPRKISEKYRGPPENRRTRSPPLRSSRRRSRSYSPHHSRHSRSPHHYKDGRYERSKREKSPRSRRYTPERRPVGIPPYFEGAEFWVPNPMLQPRFIPRQILAPGPFSYPFRPGMPPMMTQRIPFRPRIVYNNRQVRAQTPQITSTAVATTSVPSTSNQTEPNRNVPENTGDSETKNVNQSE